VLFLCLSTSLSTFVTKNLKVIYGLRIGKRRLDFKQEVVLNDFYYFDIGTSNSYLEAGLLAFLDCTRSNPKKMRLATAKKGIIASPASL
jgi:hypothetical protein